MQSAFLINRVVHLQWCTHCYKRKLPDDIHFGAFLSNSLAAITARISQDAFMDRFRILKNKALMALIPYCCIYDKRLQASDN